jgi:starch phosphorylase
MFAFGHTVGEVEALRASGYRPRAWVEANPELWRAIHTIESGELAPAEPTLFRPVVEVLLETDPYLHCADFASYLECQGRVAATYRRTGEWTRMSIRNVAGMGYFSSDRTVRDYARDVWRVGPVPVELPT